MFSTASLMWINSLGWIFGAAIFAWDSIIIIPNLFVGSNRWNSKFFDLFWLSLFHLLPSPNNFYNWLAREVPLFLISDFVDTLRLVSFVQVHELKAGGGSFISNKVPFIIKRRLCWCSGLSLVELIMVTDSVFERLFQKNFRGTAASFASFLLLWANLINIHPKRGCIAIWVIDT